MSASPNQTPSQGVRKHVDTLLVYGVPLCMEGGVFIMFQQTAVCHLSTIIQMTEKCPVCKFVRLYVFMLSLSSVRLLTSQLLITKTRSVFYVQVCVCMIVKEIKPGC